MVTVSIELPFDVAQRLQNYPDYLVEIIELGLQQLEQTKRPQPTAKQQVLQALYATGLVTLPRPTTQKRGRVTPLKVGGIPASELIIAERK